MRYTNKSNVIYYIYTYINKKNCHRIEEEFMPYWKARILKFHDTLFSIEIRQIRNVSCKISFDYKYYAL